MTGLFPNEEVVAQTTQQGAEGTVSTAAETKQQNVEDAVSTTAQTTQQDVESSESNAAKTESKKKDNDKKRSPIGEHNQKKSNFLAENDVYQLAAMHVAVLIARKGGSVDGIAERELDLLHAYFNDGASNECMSDYDKLEEHRLDRHLALVKMTEKLYVPECSTMTTAVLMRLATQRKAINKALDDFKLQQGKQPNNSPKK